ncbi:MAG: hypothetical protein IJ147_05100 [Lachnospiraceae bacterium]|nr:hypothetical protein [Lachnospiraceae bacterium]
MSRRRLVKEWIRIILGLMVFALGVHMTIYANIGLAPWDCLGMGIAKHTPFNYGISMTLIAVTVLVIDLLLKEKIGYGTIIDALLTGNFVQAFNYLNPFAENQNLLLGIGIMLIGFVFMALGMWIYMSAEQCCGPRDALLIGLGKRLSKIPIGIVEVMLWAVVLLAGFLLGGSVGIGTLISTVGAGLVMQMVYSVIRFEPRELKHKDVVEVSRVIFGKIKCRSEKSQKIKSNTFPCSCWQTSRRT